MAYNQQQADPKQEYIYVYQPCEYYDQQGNPLQPQQYEEETPANQNLQEF